MVTKVKEIDKVVLRSTASDIVKAVIGTYNNKLEQAFEHSGCSCEPDRLKLEKLQAQVVEKQQEIRARQDKINSRYQACQDKWNMAMGALNDKHNQEIEGIEFKRNTELSDIPHVDLSREMNFQSYKGPLAIQIRTLRDKINKIDQHEHPTLDNTAREAKPFFRLWVNETLRARKTYGNTTEYAREYAKAWMRGWRPFGKRANPIKTESCEV